MKANSLVSKIQKMGGTASLISEKRTDYDGRPWTKHEVVGELNGFDIHMDDLESDYFTVRHESKRDHFDPGSDYNPGGFRFCYRLRDLEQFAQGVAA
ncbi:hypothetical protein [Rhodococcus rhodochrous]|uniref:hypothetical protein n=1 Tax=Rhodococcus rhodochrous TaxID=1829 RepID=UPI00178669AD|nr:hypothetical protein [Rhodococcus rhodochrous]QOH56222.1 hypothetical protein C6Y44_09800 [Rhodococcus rhodochrous]